MSTDAKPDPTPKPVPVELPDPINAKIDHIERAAAVTAKNVERLGLPTFLLICFAICTVWIVVVGGARVWNDLVMPAKEEHFQFMRSTAATQQKLADTTSRIEVLIQKQETTNAEHRARTEQIAVTIEKLKEDIAFVRQKILTTFFGAALDPPKNKTDEPGALLP